MAEPPSDHQLFVPNLISFVVLLIFGLIFINVGVYVGFGILIAGIILVLGAFLNLVIYIMKPDKKKQRMLAKWKKKRR